MVTIEICMGSSCFLKGTAEALKTLEKLIADHGLAREVTIKGSFCMNQCTEGISMVINGELHKEVYPEHVEKIFLNCVLPISQKK